MTNEEKANEIARDMLPYNNAEYHACYNSAMKAMQWKDKEWAERFKKAFEGLWTARFNVDNLSSKTETTIEFKLVTRE